MKTIAAATVLLVLMSGFALAAADDESAFTIDLSGASQGNAHAYFLRCQYGKDMTSGCGKISVWENTNGITGLQTVAPSSGGFADGKLIS